jgi:RNA polymerase sigma-70 factor (ECF subfamily)
VTLDSTVETLAPALLRFCLGLGGDAALAEEASQDALVALIDRWRRFGPPDSPAAFAFTIARRRLRRALWRRRLLDPLSASDNGHGAVDSEAAGRLELRDALAALRRLAPRDRDVLLLVAAADCDGPTAARVLGISHAAFKMRLQRARQRLSSELGEPE